MKAVMKKVADDIYHLLIAEAVCSQACGTNLLELIKTYKIPSHSCLILETRSKGCDMTCNQAFLQGCRYFDAIAYVVQEETATYNPWKHATLIRNNHKNTHYFDSYQDALDWLNRRSEEKVERNLPRYAMGQNYPLSL